MAPDIIPFGGRNHFHCVGDTGQSPWIAFFTELSHWSTAASNSSRLIVVMKSSKSPWFPSSCPRSDASFRISCRSGATVLLLAMTKKVAGTFSSSRKSSKDTKVVALLPMASSKVKAICGPNEPTAGGAPKRTRRFQGIHASTRPKLRMPNQCTNDQLTSENPPLTGPISCTRSPSQPPAAVRRRTTASTRFKRSTRRETQHVQHAHLFEEGIFIDPGGMPTSGHHQIECASVCMRPKACVPVALSQA
mmetsp:Transcript_13481/g.36992  ORF Transcript_13481/g.36992 Transcript_13481/m.36992 type:complete len:248 (+) Transcript_13481:618-1361(+)